jgi:phosphopantothenoylcysteine decarboxylase/phosphopantothenate--cysteine ligase
MKELRDSTVIIKAAAVADYRPKTFSGSKIKKKAGPLVLNLTRNPDIIAEIGEKKGKRIVVGFAVETDHLVEYAKKKMIQKNMDLIVANDITQAGAGFQAETNVVKILDRQGGAEDLPLMDKKMVADRILDRVKSLRKKKR